MIRLFYIVLINLVIVLLLSSCRTTMPSLPFPPFRFHFELDGEVCGTGIGLETPLEMPLDHTATMTFTFKNLSEVEVASFKEMVNWGIAIGNIPSDVQLQVESLTVNGTPVSTIDRPSDQVDSTIVGNMNSQLDTLVENALIVMPTNINDLPPATVGEDYSLVLKFNFHPTVEITKPLEIKIYNAFVFLNDGESEYGVKVFDKFNPGIFKVYPEDSSSDSVTSLSNDCSSFPNLVGLNNFVVKPILDSAIIEWETLTETKNAGYRLWRAIKDQYGSYEPALLRELGQSKQVNPEPNENCSTKIQSQLKVDNSTRFPKLISAIGNSTESTCYSFTDTSNLSDGTYYYLLEDIDDNGDSTFHCDQINAVTIGQGPAIDLESAINYCKEVTGSNN